MLTKREQLNGDELRELLQLKSKNEYAKIKIQILLTHSKSHFLLIEFIAYKRKRYTLHLLLSKSDLHILYIIHLRKILLYFSIFFIHSSPTVCLVLKQKLG